MNNENNRPTWKLQDEIKRDIVNANPGIDPEGLRVSFKSTEFFVIGGKGIKKLPKDLDFGKFREFLTKLFITTQDTRIPESIGKLSYLKELTLSYQLSSLPESIGNLKNLEILTVKNNKLSSLPDSIGKLTNLKKLSLENNELSSLPNSIGKLTNLEKLSLENNKLKTLPNSIGKLTQLRFLYLNDNQLISLPESFSNLTNLYALTLDNNKLKTLPESFGNLRLKSFHINNNPIEKLPKKFRRFLHYNNTRKGYYIKQNNDEVYVISDEKIKIIIARLMNKNTIKELPTNLKRKILNNVLKNVY